LAVAPVPPKFKAHKQVDKSVVYLANKQSALGEENAVLLIVPTYTSITVYDYNSSTSVISQYNIETTKWYIKIYAWK
jgi:hypothetical protein